MKIEMNYTRRTCEDGFTVIRLEKGQTYDIAHSAATALIREGAAVEAMGEAGAALFACMASPDPLKQVEALNGLALRGVRTNPASYEDGEL